nr:hypothetical protein [Staphylococcus nepalensis]
MAVVGFEKVHVGIFDEDEKIKKLMTWKDAKGGTVNLNISGLAPEKLKCVLQIRRYGLRNKEQAKFSQNWMYLMYQIKI